MLIEKKNILVVDDEPMMLELFEMLLQRNGYGVVLCNDGQEALDHAMTATVAYDLVLTDRLMPRMLGSELARLLRESGRSQPLIMLTGMSDLTLEDHPGVNHIFVKPIDMETLLRKIETLLTPCPTL